MDNSSNPSEDIDMTVVSTSEPAADTPAMKKKDLIEAVAAKVDVKKPDVKATVEAVLEILGGALANGQSLNVPPLGKVMIKNGKTGANANVMNVRIRQSKVAAGEGAVKAKKGKKALAGDSEDS